MSFSIDTLKGLMDSQIAGGPAMACHYGVLIQPCNLMIASGAAAALPLNILNEEASLPGRQIATTDHTMYGTRVKMPYGVLYDDLTLTFICTNNMLERYFFDEWHRAITDPTNNYFNYYDDYVSDIQIYKLRPEGIPGVGADKQPGIPTYLMTVEEAYPIAIQSQELSYASETYLKLSVRFTYRRWRNVIDQVVGAVTGGLSQITAATGTNFGGLTNTFQSGHKAIADAIGTTGNGIQNLIKGKVPL